MEREGKISSHPQYPFFYIPGLRTLSRATEHSPKSDVHTNIMNKIQ